LILKKYIERQIKIKSFFGFHLLSFFDDTFITLNSLNFIQTNKSSYRLYFEFDLGFDECTFLALLLFNDYNVRVTLMITFDDESKKINDHHKG